MLNIMVISTSMNIFSRDQALCGENNGYCPHMLKSLPYNHYVQFSLIYSSIEIYV